MPTPKAGYRLKDGTKVPGATTVISSQLAWNKGALMYWAWDQGRQGKDFREERDVAADVGSLVHACIEGELRKRPWPTIPEEHKDKVDNALLAFYEWREGYQFTPLQIEGGMISERHRYGGTPDLALVRQATSLWDLKTSKDVYPDHRIQLASYGKLWNETHPEDPIRGGYHLLQVGKEDGSFHHHWYPSLEKEWQVFLLLRQLYDLQRELK